ncbi:tyrosinase cofactor [Streptomyces phaeoluteigriseus]|uniref:Tyrosinase cofactor n=1 Tax=Streptomyces phaeoluteigriseus TaxID=114686 RepID=A0ABY4ZHD8_9ACTN|nr:tyrosinase cofactor [Streptomyces phaeoluteigriseus]USQ88402.1 tyrosinase cofactor [Streptomyces phaeoluteigriseus]
MVVSVDGVAAVTTGPARKARRGTRRSALRGLLGATAALALAPLVAASRPARRQKGQGHGHGYGHAPAPALGLGLGVNAFDETYLGRHLLGRLVPPVGVADTGRWEITVDGRPLHLMRRADGTWLSMVDHYRSYADPLDAVRAAVDELGPGQMLRPAAATGRHTHMGGDHGLHP